MRKSRRLLALFLSAALALSVSLATSRSEDERDGGTKPTRLIYSAGKTRTTIDPNDNSVQKSFTDSVRAWTVNRDSELQARAAFYNSRTGETRFYGSAAFRDSARHLYADTLVFYERTNAVVAVGNVFAREKDRQFRADRVTYLKNDRLVHASGNVAIEDDAFKAAIFGENAVFNDSTGYGLVTGSPVMKKEEDPGSIITISCEDTLEISGDEKLIRLWNNVEIVKDSLKVLAGRAVYDDSLETVTLTDHPEGYHIMYDEASDAVSLLRTASTVTGDTVRIYLEERMVRGIDVLGSARSVSVWTDSTDAVYARSVLESAQIRLEMEDGMITSTVAEGTARSYYFKNETGKDNLFVNEASGDTLRFFYDGGTITQLRISGFGGGGAKGKYYGYAAEKEVTAAGDSIEVSLE